MKLELYAYYDKITGLYTAPLLIQNQQAMIRHFNYQLKDTQNASDYELYFIGYYNEHTAQIEPVEKPVFVIRGVYEQTRHDSNH